MAYIEPILLILAGILAASALIIAKKPSAKDLIAKIAPYQAFMGATLFGFGIYNFFIWVGIGNMVRLLTAAPLFGIVAWVSLGCSMILGFVFGLPLLAKWSGGSGGQAAARAENFAKKVAPFQTLLGVLAIVSGFLLSLYQFGILKVG